MLGLVLPIMPSLQAPLLTEPTLHKLPVSAWNATSKEPLERPVMLGLLPAFIPSCQFLLPAAPIVIRRPVLAWNAIS